MARPFSIACILVAACILAVEAAVETGTINTDGFAFAGKFCFKEGDPAGTLDATLTLPYFDPGSGPDYSDVRIVFYDDQSFSWPEMLDHWDDWNCDAKVANAKNTGGDLANAITYQDGKMTLQFTPGDFHQITRPRFWFYGFARCNGGFTDASFRLHFQQSNENGWNREFGENESGMNTLYLAFFLFFSIVIVINCVGTYKLQQKLSYLHPLIKLFLIVLILEYLALFVLLIHYGSYASNGEGILILMKLGEVLEIVSRVCFMLLLLLLAKGWTISNETLTHKWAIIGIVVSYLALSVFILVWTYSMEDPLRSYPGKTEEALSIMVNSIWLVFAIWFVVQIISSYRRENNPSKKSMFLKLCLIFGVWFLLLPIVNLGVFYFDPWVREKIVATFSVGVTTIAYAILVFLFWPSRAEEYFSIATPDVMGERNYDEDYATL